MEQSSTPASAGDQHADHAPVSADTGPQADMERRIEVAERRLWSVERARLVHAMSTAATRWRHEQVDLDDLTAAGRKLVDAADALFAHRLTKAMGR
jgi:hypothetical protein